MGNCNIRKSKNGDILIYETREPKTFINDRNLKFKEAYFIIDEKDTVIKNIKLSEIQNDNLRSVIFSGQMKSKTLKKIIKKENIVLIFKNDGSIFDPNSTN